MFTLGNLLGAYSDLSWRSRHLQSFYMAFSVWHINGCEESITLVLHPILLLDLAMCCRHAFHDETHWKSRSEVVPRSPKITQNLQKNPKIRWFLTVSLYVPKGYVLSVLFPIVVFFAISTHRPSSLMRPRPAWPQLVAVKIQDTFAGIREPRGCSLQFTIIPFRWISDWLCLKMGIYHDRPWYTMIYP